MIDCDVFYDLNKKKCLEKVPKSQFNAFHHWINL